MLGSDQVQATSRIDEPEFVQIWNLLDIVAILSDDGQCEPALLFWLVEELLDSQTIAGCRKIFDYLESRRERITAKHFKQKNLVILRTCNELLRRLSRAEDTAFCGRVFIFMFQSFPLGDKSSVNLRGEYHVENVTTFDVIPGKTELPADQMDIDTDIKQTAEESKNNSKSVTFNAKGEKPVETPLDADSLYPIFWSLQQIFSQPKRLFDEKYFTGFKKGLEATMVMFRSVQNEQTDRNPPKLLEDGKKTAKRKRGEGEDDLANTFNPKYLTSRDLFELEISDLSFRRHILVQALIVMDFLISLSSKAKEKLTRLTTQNKSVMYQDQVISEDDIKWASNTKKSIEQYLKEGFEGPFFHRMVETVLSRDKNWVRWKIENCPSIERPAVTPEEYLAAKAGARKAAAVKRLRPKPMGSLDLAFLSQSDGAGDMARLKDPARYEVPPLASFREKIALDELEIEMPESDESKEAAIYGKASKSWQALRIASKTKLAAFDKIEDPEKIDSIFQEETTEDKDAGDENAEVEDVAPPADKRPIIISGPSGAGKGTLIGMLITKYPKLFGKKASHTTRAPRVGEEDGVHYYFINLETYNMMRDGDQFLEFNNFNGNDYGTSRKVVEGIVAAGKIPVMEMDYHVSFPPPLPQENVDSLNQ
jgi:THO complex subunit 1